MHACIAAFLLLYAMQIYVYRQKKGKIGFGGSSVSAWRAI